MENKSDFKNNDTVNQIKNITQEKNTKPKIKAKSNRNHDINQLI